MVELPEHIVSQMPTRHEAVVTEDALISHIDDVVSISARPRNISQVQAAAVLTPDHDSGATRIKYMVKYSKTDNHYLCPLCMFRTAGMSVMKVHLLKHAETKLHICNICFKTFPNTDDLNSHIQVHSEVFKCSNCSFSSSCKTLLTEHEAMHLKSAFKCPVCHKFYKSGKGLKHHIYCIHMRNRNKTKTTSDKAKCEKKKGNKTRTETDKAKCEKKKENKRVKCTVCSRVFSSSNIQKHMRVHQSADSSSPAADQGLDQHKDGLESSISIKVSSTDSDELGPPKAGCDKQNTGHETKRIKKRANISQQKQTYLCRPCKFQTTKIGEMKVHLMKHGDTRKHVCDFCLSGFADIDSLDSHMQLHDITFNCPYCSFSSRFHSMFEEHKTIHSQYIFKCSICPCKFERMRSLTMHLRIHRIQNPKTDKYSKADARADKNKYMLNGQFLLGI